MSGEKLLWGGRFKAPPDPALMNLSRAAPSYFRLVPEDLVGCRAHARELERAGLLDAGESARILSAYDEIERDIAAGRAPTCRPTKTSTPSRTPAHREARPARRQAARRALAQRPDRQRPAPVSCVPAPARSWRSCSASPHALAGAGASACRERGARLHPSAAGAADRRSPITCWRMPRRCCATSSVCSTGTGAPRARHSAPPPWRARPSRSGRSSRPPKWATAARAKTPSTPSPAAITSPSSCSHRQHARRQHVAPRRRGLPVVVAAVPLGRAGRCLRHRQLDHAAEEEPGHRRTGARQGGALDRQPDRPAGHPQIPAAVLQPRLVRGQARRVRQRRQHAAGAARHGRHGPRP